MKTAWQRLQERERAEKIRKAQKAEARERAQKARAPKPHRDGMHAGVEEIRKSFSTAGQRNTPRTAASKKEAAQPQAPREHREHDFTRIGKSEPGTSASPEVVVDCPLRPAPLPPDYISLLRTRDPV